MPKGKPYQLHPEAWHEFVAADDWYLSRSFDESLGFLSDVHDSLEAISEVPQGPPKYLHGTRRFVLQHFPFSVIYLDDPEVVTIIAFAHSKREPGYWKHLFYRVSR